jgi:hypothetical protein
MATGEDLAYSIKSDNMTIARRKLLSRIDRQVEDYQFSAYNYNREIIKMQHRLGFAVR